MEQIATRPRPGTRRNGFSSGVILVAGVLLVPMVITIATNSWSAPEAHDYVRMAFAQVAGAAVAMTTAVALAVHRIVHRSSLGDTVWFGAIAVAIVVWQMSNLSYAADLLLQRLTGGA